MPDIPGLSALFTGNYADPAARKNALTVLAGKYGIFEGDQEYNKLSAMLDRFHPMVQATREWLIAPQNADSTPAKMAELLQVGTPREKEVAKERIGQMSPAMRDAINFFVKNPVRATSIAARYPYGYDAPTIHEQLAPVTDRRALAPKPYEYRPDAVPKPNWAQNTLAAFSEWPVVKQLGEGVSWAGSIAPAVGMKIAQALDPNDHSHETLGDWMGRVGSRGFLGATIPDQEWALMGESGILNSPTWRNLTQAQKLLQEMPLLIAGGSAATQAAKSLAAYGMASGAAAEAAGAAVPLSARLANMASKIVQGAHGATNAAMGATMAVPGVLGAIGEGLDHNPIGAGMNIAMTLPMVRDLRGRLGTIAGVAPVGGARPTFGQRLGAVGNIAWDMTGLPGAYHGLREPFSGTYVDTLGKPVTVDRGAISADSTLRKGATPEQEAAYAAAQAKRMENLPDNAGSSPRELASQYYKSLIAAKVQPAEAKRAVAEWAKAQLSAAPGTSSTVDTEIRQKLFGPEIDARIQERAAAEAEAIAKAEKDAVEAAAREQAARDLAEAEKQRRADEQQAAEEKKIQEEAARALAGATLKGAIAKAAKGSKSTPSPAQAPTPDIEFQPEPWSKNPNVRRETVKRQLDVLEAAFQHAKDTLGRDIAEPSTELGRLIADYATTIEEMRLKVSRGRSVTSKEWENYQDALHIIDISIRDAITNATGATGAPAPTATGSVDLGSTLPTVPDAQGVPAPTGPGVTDPRASVAPVAGDPAVPAPAVTPVAAPVAAPVATPSPATQGPDVQVTPTPAAPDTPAIAAPAQHVPLETVPRDGLIDALVRRLDAQGTGDAITPDELMASALEARRIHGKMHDIPVAGARPDLVDALVTRLGAQGPGEVITSAEIIAAANEATSQYNALVAERASNQATPTPPPTPEKVDFRSGDKPDPQPRITAEQVSDALGGAPVKILPDGRYTAEMDGHTVEIWYTNDTKGNPRALGWHMKVDGKELSETSRIGLIVGKGGYPTLTHEAMEFMISVGVVPESLVAKFKGNTEALAEQYSRWQNNGPQNSPWFRLARWVQHFIDKITGKTVEGTDVSRWETDEAFQKLNQRRTWDEANKAWSKANPAERAANIGKAQAADKRVARGLDPEPPDFDKMREQIIALIGPERAAELGYNVLGKTTADRDFGSYRVPRLSERAHEVFSEWGMMRQIGEIDAEGKPGRMGGSVNFERTPILETALPEVARYMSHDTLNALNAELKAAQEKAGGKIPAFVEQLLDNPELARAMGIDPEARSKIDATRIALQASTLDMVQKQADALLRPSAETNMAAFQATARWELLFRAQHGNARLIGQLLQSLSNPKNEANAWWRATPEQRAKMGIDKAMREMVRTGRKLSAAELQAVVTGEKLGPDGNMVKMNQAEAFAEFLGIKSKLSPPSGWDYFSHLLRASLLSNPKGAFKDLVCNILNVSERELLAPVADWAMAKRQGEAYSHKGAWIGLHVARIVAPRQAWSAMVDFWRDGYSERTALGPNAPEIPQNEMPEVGWTGGLTKVANRVYRMRNVADSGPMIYAQTMEYGRQLGQAGARLWRELNPSATDSPSETKFIQDFVKEGFDPERALKSEHSKLFHEAADVAVARAQDLVYRSKLNNKGLALLESAVRGYKPFVLVMPFPHVPMKIIEHSFDRAGLGWKALAKGEKDNLAALRLNRAIGMAIVAPLAMYLGKQGYIRADQALTHAKREMDKARNLQSYSVYIPGFGQIPVLQMFGSYAPLVVALGMFANRLEHGYPGGLSANLMATGIDAGGAIYNSVNLQNLSRAGEGFGRLTRGTAPFGASDAGAGLGSESIMAQAGNLAAAQARMLVPMSGALGYITQLIDPLKRDMKASSVGEGFLNTIKTTIPFWSKTVPASQDMSGQGYTRGMFELLAGIAPRVDNPTVDVIEKSGNEYGGVQKRHTVNKVNVNLPPDELRQLRQADFGRLRAAFGDVDPNTITPERHKAPVAQVLKNTRSQIRPYVDFAARRQAAVEALNNAKNR